MMKTPKLPALLFLSPLLLAGVATFSRAEVKPDYLFSSHMVLQQQMPCPVFGTADPGESVSVQLDSQPAVTATADSSGAWKATLPPLTADGGKPHTLTITGKNTVKLDDVLIGEVWVASGQSNMERGFDKGADFMNVPEIRIQDGALGGASGGFPRKGAPAAAPVAPVAPGEDTTWKVCSSETAVHFSEVAFYFAQRLNKELGVPVGLINRSKGSTPIAAFMPPPANGPLYVRWIKALQPFAIRGVIWYQGEANRDDGLKYAAKQQTMIEGWRQAWGLDFSFYIVQIAPFTGYTTRYDIPSLWEAQLEGLKIPKVGVVITNDTAGSMTNMHPGNKDKVGQRLAGWALAKDYGKTGFEYSSPMYKSMTVQGSTLRLSFAHAAGLKTSNGGPLTGFEIAGADGKYVPATATIDGETVVVQAPGVTPTMARYDWENTPHGNLVNGADLPSSAFHTDDWQGGTGDENSSSASTPTATP